MSYPEAYDMKFKRWSLQTLPFLPKEFKYEVITNVSKQFEIVKGLLNRPAAGHPEQSVYLPWPQASIPPFSNVSNGCHVVGYDVRHFPLIAAGQCGM